MLDGATMLARVDGEPIRIVARCTEDAVVFDIVTASRLQWWTGEGRKWLWLRTRLDQWSADDVVTTSAFNNALSLTFTDAFARLRRDVSEQARRAARDNAGAAFGVDAAADPAAFMKLTILRAGYYGFTGTIDTLIHAGAIRAEIPLADGRKPVVTIDTADRALQSFLASCPAVRG
jgi:hypothetical protein